MFFLKEKDFQNISGFPLLWRWDNLEPGYQRQDVLSKIRVLRKEKAASLDTYLHPDCKKLSLYIFEPWRVKTDFSDLEYIHHFNIQKKTDRETKAWFFSLGIPPDTEMLASWEREVAITLPWNILSHYWDDFFYPGQDDICIGSFNNIWSLLFYHEGDFVCGKRKFGI